MAWRKIAIFDEDGAISVGDGVKFNKLTSAPSSPVEGQVYYDDTDDRLYLYDGSSWKKILCEGDVAGGSDEKVKTSSSDPTAGYLVDKLDSNVFEEGTVDSNYIMKLKEGITQHITFDSDHGIKFLKDPDVTDDYDKLIAPTTYGVGIWKWDGTQWVKGTLYCDELSADTLVLSSKVRASVGIDLGNQTSDPTGVYTLAKVNHALKFYDEDDSTWKEIFVGDRATPQNLILKGADKIIRWVDAADTNKMLEMYLSDIAGEVDFRYTTDGGSTWSKPDLRNINILEAEQLLALASLAVSGSSSLMGAVTVGGDLDLGENEAINFAIENVSSLPSTTKAGRIVFNTADNHLYVYVP